MSKSKPTVLEVWVCVDTNGDYCTGNDADEARNRYTEDIGPLEETDGFRLFKCNLNVTLPTVRQLAVTVPDDEGDAVLTA